MRLNTFTYTIIVGSDYIVQSAIFSAFNETAISSFVILSDIEKRIKEKIEKIGTPLKDWDIQINYGIKTGYNEAFIIDGKTREELIEKSKPTDLSSIIRPILRGRDIKKYGYEFADLWLLYIPWHFPLHKKPNITGASEEAEKEFQKQYPDIYEHLLKYKKELSARNKAETGIRYEWYALQRWGANYMDNFYKQKIIYSETNNSDETKVGFDEKGEYFTDKTCFILLGKTEIITKHIYKLMSSKVFTWYMKMTSPLLGTQGISLTKESVETFPACPIGKNYDLTDDEIQFIEN